MIKTEHTLLVERYRPTKLENYVGNEHIKQAISSYLGQNDIQNLIFLRSKPVQEKLHLLNLLLKTLIVIIFILMPLMKGGLKLLEIKYRVLRAQLVLNHLKWSFWMKLIFLLSKRRLLSAMSLKPFLERLGL